jgi:O-antigen/teichoic acid export membrane protein
MYIAPLFLPLPVIGSYGITMQIASMIGQVGVTWFGTFYPQLAQYTVQQRNEDVKRLYIKALFILFAVYALLGTGFMLFGQDILIFLKSRTLLLGGLYIFAILLFALLDQAQNIATAIFTSRNEIPHYKSYLAAGGLTVLFCVIMFMFDKHVTAVFGVWSLILSAGLATGCYILWKWPLEVAKYLNLKWQDVYMNISEMWKENKQFLAGKICIKKN